VVGQRPAYSSVPLGTNTNRRDSWHNGIVDVANCCNILCRGLSLLPIPLTGHTIYSVFLHDSLFIRSLGMVKLGGNLSVMLPPKGIQCYLKRILPGGNAGFKLRLGWRLYFSLLLWGLSIGRGGIGGISIISSALEQHSVIYTICLDLLNLAFLH
jgi:hypothetical protein